MVSRHEEACIRSLTAGCFVESGISKLGGSSVGQALPDGIGNCQSVLLASNFVRQSLTYTAEYIADCSKIKHLGTTKYAKHTKNAVGWVVTQLECDCWVKTQPTD